MADVWIERSWSSGVFGSGFAPGAGLEPTDPWGVSRWSPTDGVGAGGVLGLAVLPAGALEDEEDEDEDFLVDDDEEDDDGFEDEDEFDDDDLLEDEEEEDDLDGDEDLDDDDL